MAYSPGRTVSPPRPGALPIAPSAASPKALKSNSNQTLRKVGGPAADTAARKLRLLEPYDDFDILATAGHNIG